MDSKSLYQAVGVRVVSVILVALLALILSPMQLFLLVVVLGQGHFLLAYMYQAENGHLKSHKILFLVALFIFFSWVLFLVSFAMATFLTAVGFLVHFAIDEARLYGKKHSLFTTLEALPFFLVYSALLAETLFKVHVFYFICLVVFVILILYVYLSYKKKRKPNSASYSYFGWLLVTFIAYAIYVSNPTYTNDLVWFDCLVIVHYFIWYGFYWFKLIDKTLQQTVYVWRAVLVNAVLAFLAFFWSTEHLPLLDVLFAPVMFYVWTWVHYISSLRKDEYLASLRL